MIDFGLPFIACVGSVATLRCDGALVQAVSGPGAEGDQDVGFHRGEDGLS